MQKGEFYTFVCYYLLLFFFFKQKTAYEMRISDWSSDVCSSDLMKAKVSDELKQHFRPEFLNRVDEVIVFPPLSQEQIIAMVDKIGRASCRERVCQYV